MAYNVADKRTIANLSFEMFELQQSTINQPPSEYPFQKGEAAKILEEYVCNDKSLITYVAPTQMGKTSLMYSLWKAVSTHPDDALFVPFDQVFLITGVSDLEWLEQTRSRFPKHFHDNIFMNGGLDKFSERVAQCDRCLIMIDECHYGNSHKQRLSKALVNANIPERVKNGEKILIFHTSATPENTGYDADQWDLNKHQKIIAPVDAVSSYVWFDKLDMRPLRDLNDKTNFVKLAKRMLSFKTPKYHLIRVNKYEEEFHDWIPKMYKIGFTVTEHNQKHRMENGWDLKAPIRHTVIVFKNMLRVGKTISSQHIGVVYDNKTQSKQYACAVVQGFAGRMTGHNKPTKMDPGHPIIYCDVETIKDYMDSYLEGFANGYGHSKEKLTKTYIDPVAFGAEVQSADSSVDGDLSMDLDSAAPQRNMSRFFPVETPENPTYPKAAIKAFLSENGVETYKFNDKFKFKKSRGNKTEDGRWKSRSTDGWHVREFDVLKRQNYHDIALNNSNERTESATICYHNGVLGVGVFLR